MSDPATITGGPSEAAVEAAQAHFDRPRCRTVIVDSRNTAQALAAAYAVDEPRIRADQTRRIEDWAREQAAACFANTDDEPGERWRRFADAIARKFGASA